MTIDQKKKLNAYYTPELVTNALSNWIVRNCDDKILEPSFGGCNFLISSLNAFRDLGCKSPQNNINGFDIDPNAFKILNEKGLQSDNFILGDFLMEPVNEGFQSDAVLGNPPYQSIHKMEETYKLALFKKYSKDDFKIARRSSLWVYFIVHSFKYLKMGGRMAWVVPDSISFSNYGKIFLNQLEEKFKEVILIRVEERFFMESGTHEKTSFLLCDGYLMDRCKTNIVAFSTLDHAIESVSNYKKDDAYIKQIKLVNSFHLTNTNNFAIKKINDIFDIRIGIVVGASKLLILNEKQARQTPYYPDYVYPIISKGKQLTGISIDKDKLISDDTAQIYLIDGLKMEKENPTLFTSFLLSIPTKILLNQTFKSRKNLFGYDNFIYPDAFLTYYSQEQAKIIINEKKELNCTNSVHRLYFKKGINKSKTLLKFYVLQLFSGLMHNETKAVAREYSNNIYKYEPSDAGNIPVIVPLDLTKKLRKDIDKLFISTEKLIKKGKIQEAKICALNNLYLIINELKSITKIPH